MIVVNDIAVPHVPRTMHGDRVNVEYVINTRRPLRIITPLRIFVIVSSSCGNRGFTVDVSIALRA